MSKARDLIKTHLYPVLATFAVIYGAIQIAPIAQHARDIEMCAKVRANILMAKKSPEDQDLRVELTCSAIAMSFNSSD